MQTILVTGFEPFGGDSINPAMEAVGRLAAMPPDGVRLVTAILPTRYRQTQRALRAAIERATPDIVVSVGQAGNRAEISVERVAINVDDARIPDNDGVQRIDEPVIAGGPAAYFATLPIKTLVASIRAGGVPAHVSQTAGTFLCNHVFYAARHIAATERPAMRVGFIHVPQLPEQAARNPGTPSMALETITRALRIAVETLRDAAVAPPSSGVASSGAVSGDGATVAADLRVAEGAIS